MAVQPTVVSYPGDGSTTVFTFQFDYLDEAYVKVRVDNVEVPFTFNNTKIIEVDTAPSVGQTLIISRETERSNLVDFVDGSVLIEDDLDLSSTQLLHIVQEAIDLSFTNNDDSAVNAAAAEASREAARQYLEDLTDRYMGPLASAPTELPSGGPLEAGSFYYDTTLSTLQVWTGAAWASAPQGPQGEKGDQGDAGPQGDKGDPGDDAAVPDRASQGEAQNGVENNNYMTPLRTAQAIAAQVSGWTELPVVSAAGTSIPFDNLPAGLKAIDIYYHQLASTLADNVLIQLGDSEGIETSGYQSASNYGGAHAGSSSGLVAYLGNTSRTLSGICRLRRMPGTNTWVYGFSGADRASAGLGGGGHKTLSGELDQLQIVGSLGGTFNLGDIAVTYR